MGNKPSFMLQDEEITLINEETGFSPAQIERLYSRFTTLDKSGNGSLSRQDCLAIPELAINPLCDRIVHMFFIDCDDDHERINFRQFMKVLATFRSSQSKSSPLSRSRNVSRQESLNQQQQQSILKQAPLLFDSIDPTSLSALSRHHARHSSYHEGFQDIHSHHTTNQHSFHYAASTNHLPHLHGHHHLGQNGVHHHHHSLNHQQNNNLSHHNNNHNHHTSNNLLTNGNGLGSVDGSTSDLMMMKKIKQVQLPLIEPDEPPNSRKQKLYFMFKIYDVNDDHLVDLDDLIAILKMMVGTYVDDAQIQRIAQRTLREADKDCDGYIDFDEFYSAFSRKDIDESMRVNFRIHAD